MRTAPHPFDFTKRARIVAACGILAFICFLASFTYWERVVLVEKPEFLRAYEFVKTSVVVREEFGDLKSVERAQGYRYEWLFSRSEKSSGHFEYDVIGTRASGVVTVYWEYYRRAAKFVVTRVIRRLPLGDTLDITSKPGKMPNQALEPTTTAVTPAADAPVAPPVVVAHLKR